MHFADVRRLISRSVMRNDIRVFVSGRGRVNVVNSEAGIVTHNIWEIWDGI